jgi:aspartyl-tRNA(Asn)/glutamyl-tRNA(Gln) amidotransferase subunit A
MVAIEAYAEHRAIVESADAERMDRRVVKRALGGRAATGHDVINLQWGRERLIAALADDLKGALLVLPVTPMCGLALPSGTDVAGLPTGVQFLAPRGDDDRLLSVGLSIESALSR